MGVQKSAGLLSPGRGKHVRDIVSDLCAGLVGGLGFAPSANLGDTYAVFEPTHGSAPKYAGQYKVNPIAMLLTTKLMLDWLKEAEMASNTLTDWKRLFCGDPELPSLILPRQ